MGALILSAATAAFAKAELPTLQLKGCSPGRKGKSSRCLSIGVETKGAPVASAGFRVEYDAKVVRLRNGSADVSPGSGLTAGHNVTATISEEASPATVSVMVTPPVRLPIALLADGELVRICFEVSDPKRDPCRAISLVPSSVEMGDDRGHNMEIAPPRAADARPVSGSKVPRP